MIPIARPDLGEDEVEAVAAVIRSGMVAQGPRVRALEAAWAAYCGAPHAVAVGNGTLALMATLACLGIGAGDEVVTVSHTFAATANAILMTGARPVFIDVEPDTFLMDPDRLEAAIGPQTRAVMPVHLYGLVADMDRIGTIAARHGVPIIEDASQAHGATFGGRRAGSFGHGTFSLYATKNMTTAEGGFITTADDGLADRLRVYRNQGMRARYEFELLGVNYRMTDLQAAIGLVQLAKLDRNNGRRAAIAARYDAAFADLPVRTPIVPAGRTHAYHQYVLTVGPGRDAILADIRAAGVSADVYYPVPVHRQRYITERGLTADLPVTDRIAETTLALPIFPGLTEAEAATVIAAVRAAVASHGGPGRPG